ncbi:hypothetical protein ACFQ88_22300 [Paenibacillus sp. NPDC056579]|uniref:hypothetical protein n=1 Tax=Paenibacillus sp. NPDC056579 TaxID=3345871 RepID=UPI0036D11E2E
MAEMNGDKVPVYHCPRCGQVAQEVGRLVYIEVGAWDASEKQFEGETDAEEFQCTSCNIAFFIEF